MEAMPPEFQEHLRRLAAQPDCATSIDDYPLWLMEQTQDVLLDLLRGSGIRLTGDLLAQLARWTFDAALVGKCLLERMTAAQARLAVLAPVVNGLLLQADDLCRLPPPAFRPGPAERAILAEFRRTGAWQLVRTSDRVEAVRDEVYQEALARLPARDALLIGLVPAVGGVGEALRVLDLEETAALEALSEACRRLELTVQSVVERHLQPRPPHFSSN